MFLIKKEKKMADNIVNIITNVGFPVAVAAYLLVRMESRLTELKDSINALTVAISKWQQ